MGNGNYRAPGDHEGRPNEMIYVNMTDYEDDLRAIRVDDVYDTIRRSVPKSFTVTDRRVYGAHPYEVFMENDNCEIVCSDEDSYFAVAFVAKESKKGWFKNWKRTALKVFRNLHSSGLHLTYRTSAWTSSEWTPNEYRFCGKKHRGINDHHVS